MLEGPVVRAVRRCRRAFALLACLRASCHAFDLSSTEGILRTTNPMRPTWSHACNGTFNCNLTC